MSILGSVFRQSAKRISALSIVTRPTFRPVAQLSFPSAADALYGGHRSHGVCYGTQEGNRGRLRVAGQDKMGVGDGERSKRYALTLLLQ